MAHKLFPNWGWSLTQPAPFDTLASGQIRRTDICSRFTSGTKKTATIHPCILQAMIAYANLENETPPDGDFTGSIGSQDNQATVCEYPSRTETLHVVTFNRSTGRFCAGCYSAPVDVETPLPYVLGDGKQTGTALFFALIPSALEEPEFNEYYLKFKEDHASSFYDVEEAAKTVAILCDNLYRRISYPANCGDDGLIVNINAGGNIPKLKTLSLKKGIYAPTNVISGVFEVLKADTHTPTTEIIIHDDLVGKYCLSERSLTVLEEQSIPKLPDWYIIPSEVKRICEHAKLTTDGQQPMRNFLLRGPAGTGKTEGAKAIAAGLHLPYRSLTCNANTEIFDLLGQIIPDTGNSGNDMHQSEYPTLADIQADPASAYCMLTGEYNETITETAVYDMLLAKAAEDAKQSVSTDSKQRFRYMDTPLVEAMRFGYCLEIQEPTVISNPGVLVGLNSLLDRCNSVTLPNGEIINRHPDTVIIVTTNSDYAGCKDINQSVISRMNLIMDINEPDENTLVARVSGITGCGDLSSIRQMAKLIKQISSHCKESMITDGSCGVRELISWVQSFMICNDIMEAALYTVLSSVSADEDCRLEVQTACLDTALAA